MAAAATRFVGLEAADLDGGSLGRRGLSVDQALIARCELTALNTNRVQLVDDFGDRKKLRNGSEGLAAEVHVSAGDDHANTSVGERGHDINDTIIQELHFVDGDDFGIGSDAFGQVEGIRYRFGYDSATVV